ncbi:AbrB/MazE/SpoVT family DNA-binding domain-containing protein [Glaciimonas sp. GG7]
MTILTVTARGQVTFRKDVLKHLGIKPGDQIKLDLLPDGRVIFKAVQLTGTIEGFVGLLADRSQKSPPLNKSAQRPRKVGRVMNEGLC